MSYDLRGNGIVVVGGQWGDEGKGRIVDSIAEHCDVVVRFQGGNNAGHSLHIGQQAIVMHLIPCGIMRKDKICIIGNGVVIDPEVLFEEIELLSNHGIRCTPERLKIAKNAHIILPFHKLIDASRETNSESHLGTTKRGIGPCYEDKVARFGILARDLLSADTLKRKLHNIFINRKLSNIGDCSEYIDQLLSQALIFGKKMAPFLCDTGGLLYNYLKQGRRVLFEGAQGALLDVDHGSYPYVTSSNCVAAQAAIGSGVGVNWLNDILMVSKAYCTRVGEGPFFTEASVEEQEQFRTLGHEFGATTGRPRRCGWLDVPALRYAARINGATALVLTKIDILSGLDRIRIGTAYSYNNKTDLTFYEAMELYSHGEKIEVIYKEFPAIGPIPAKAKKLSDLPPSVQDLCAFIEGQVGLPIRIISFGRERGQEFFITS